MKLTRSEFARNVLTLLSGTTFAHAIPFIISPLISRLYDPQDFDLLGVYTAVVMLLSPVITGTYDQAVNLPKDDRQAANITLVTLMLSLIVSALLVPIVLLYNHPISEFLNTPDLADWLVFIPLSLLLVSTFNTLGSWFSRIKQFNYVANSQILQTGGISAVNIGLGYLNFGSAGLVIGRIVGQALSVLMLFYCLFTGRKRFSGLSLQVMLDALKTYRDFPKFSLPRIFLDGLSRSSIFFLIPLFFASGVLGSYTWMSKIIGAPLTLIGLAMSKVYYQRAADAYNNRENVWPILRNVILTLTLVAVPVVLLMLVGGPWLFSFIFGAKWLEAGRYAQIMTPWFMANFILIPISQTSMVFDRQRSFFLLNAGYNIASMVLFGVVGYLTADPILSFILLSASGTLMSIAIILWLVALAKRLETAPEHVESAADDVIQ